ncbi:hypothetical protein RDABS01_021772 [Bienertia sinuspersici]
MKPQPQPQSQPWEEVSRLRNVSVWLGVLCSGATGYWGMGCLLLAAVVGREEGQWGRGGCCGAVVQRDRGWVVLGAVEGEGRKAVGQGWVLLAAATGEGRGEVGAGFCAVGRVVGLWGCYAAAYHQRIAAG